MGSIVTPGGIARGYARDVRAVDDRPPGLVLSVRGVVQGAVTELGFAPGSFGHECFGRLEPTADSPAVAAALEA